MSNDNIVSNHYSRGDLLKAIQTAILKLGKTVDSITIEDLIPVDEFHVGGRLATERFIGQFNFSERDHILDVGCGLGGSARYVASKYSTRVTGIDLTQEYIETGKALCSWVKLDKRVTLHQGNALAMPFQNGAFDGGYMLNVGMNIENKSGLFKEIYRVLRPGSCFGVYDIMRQRNGELAYPVPWATDQGTCELATVTRYKQALGNAGFKISKESNRREFALNLLNRLRSKTRGNDNPYPIGLHILMRKNTSIMIENMITNIENNLIVPIEVFAKKSNRTDGDLHP